MQRDSIAALVLAFAIGGAALRCGAAPGRVREADLIGLYEFQEFVVGSKHGLETLNLKADGTYAQSYLSPGDKQVRTNTGTWKLFAEPDASYVRLHGLRSWGVDRWGANTGPEYRDDANFDVEVTEHMVRLVVNIDLDQAFVRRSDRARR